MSSTEIQPPEKVASLQLPSVWNKVTPLDSHLERLLVNFDNSSLLLNKASTSNSFGQIIQIP